MARYRDDPRWITARYQAECVKCKKKVPKGSRAFYWPKNRHIACEGCGEEAAAEFTAQAWDDDNNTCL